MSVTGKNCKVPENPMNLAYFRITDHLHDSVLAEDSVQRWGRRFQPQFTGTYKPVQFPLPAPLDPDIEEDSVPCAS
jgi:hypothetical protein